MLFLYNYRDDRRNREAVGVSAATQSAGPKKRNCVFCSVKYSRKQMGAAVSEYFNDISKCNGECVEHKSLCMLVALSQVSGKKASWSASAWSGLFGVSCACCMSLFSFLHLVSSVPSFLPFHQCLLPLYCIQTQQTNVKMTYQI